MNDMTCPRCGCTCCRDEVDIGVGIQYGPWLCPRCGWNQDDAIDKLFKKKPPHGNFDGCEQGGPGGSMTNIMDTNGLVSEWPSVNFETRMRDCLLMLLLHDAVTESENVIIKQRIARIVAKRAKGRRDNPPTE